MANITDYLNKIKSAVYGKDVRSSIHDGIKSINNEIETTTSKQKLLDQKFTEQIKNMTNNNPSIAEVVDARIGLDAKVYDTLGQRLDDQERNLKYLKKQQTFISKFHDKLLKNEGVSIGLYGDSMTYGYDIVSDDRRDNSVVDNAGNTYNKTIASVTYPEAFKTIMDEVYGDGKVEVVVRAVGGDYVKKAIERWLPKTHPIGTDVCVMNYGINDSRLASCPYAGDTNEFLKYYRELIEAELDNGTAVILMTPFKVSTTDVRIQTFETAVMNLAKEYGIPVIVGDEMAANMSYKWYSDATHWNGEGYKYVGTRIAACFIGDGLINPTRVSENTQLLTRRQLDGIWWDSKNTEIYHSSPSSYPTPDEAVDEGGLAIRIGTNGTVYYSFYAEKDLWIAPYIGLNEGSSCAELKLNFGLESPDYSFDNFPMLGGNVDYSKRAVTTINYTKDMPKASSRIHLGSILVDELPCLRTVTKGWHTVSITAKNGSIGLGGLIFVDTSYFETIRNRYTKFRNSIEVKPADLSYYRDLTIYRDNPTGEKRSIHFGPNLRSNEVSASIWVKDIETDESLNMLSVTPTGTKLNNNITLIPETQTDAKALMIVRQKKDETDTFRGNFGLFSYNYDTKIGAGMALYDYNDTSDPKHLSSMVIDNDAVVLRKYRDGAADSSTGLDIGDSSFKTKDIYSINGIIQVSDRNAKDNITDTDLGLDFINQLRPVNYTFKNGTSGRIHTGLIAQEVEDVLGDNDKALLIKSNTVDENTGEENVSYSLRYTELIGPIIKAIQELDEKINKIVN
ncbi:MAG: tail fiber domain-containing protein [Turicibacter sp.]|nr:tail fiber domain-containing protein [Turicibacter sp.]